MIAAGRLAAAFASLLFPRPPAAGPLAVSTPATLDEAIATVLAPRRRAASTPGPLVLGVGELHQTAGTAGIASSLSRFTHKIWPLIAARVSDLIVETWVTDGACGKAEAATVGDVARTTERPAATENEIVDAAHAREGVGRAAAHLEGELRRVSVARAARRRRRATERSTSNACSRSSSTSWKRR